MKVQSTNSQHKREEVHKMVAGPAMVSGLEEVVWKPVKTLTSAALDLMNVLDTHNKHRTLQKRRQP